MRRPTRLQMGELFELSLSGGPAERTYRRARPEVLRLPWTAPLGVKPTEAQREEARRHWTVAALQEYRSAFAQAQVLETLVAARVPLDLSALAARFPVDELAHAEVCARVANVLGGGAPVVFDAAQVFAPSSAGGNPTLLEAAMQVARLYAVGEGWSLGILEALRKRARVPLLRAVWTALVRDEAAHARFAWTFLAWAKTELDAAGWRQVQCVVDEESLRLEESWRGIEGLAASAFSPIGPLGSGGAAAYVGLARQALRKRVTEPFAALP